MSDEATGMRELWSMPFPSHDFEEGPQVQVARDQLTLSYDYETESGAYEWESLTFGGVVAVLLTLHESCAPEQIDAYDRLVEIPNSSWLTKLQAARLDWAEGLRHLRIYFDEYGCFDIAATSFETPEARNDGR